jgi:superfamily II DNA helicase RecQ
MQGAGSSKLKADRFPLFGALSSWTQAAIRDLLVQMEEEGLLAGFEKGRYRLLRLTDEGRARMDAQPKVESTPTAMPLPPATALHQKIASTPSDGTDMPTQYDENLYGRLRAWQLKVARKRGIAPFFVLPMDTLKRIAAQRPTTLEELATVKGIGPSKMKAYGHSVLDIVRRE